MNCSNCGTSIRPGDSYCTVCGTKVPIDNNQINNNMSNNYQYQNNYQQSTQNNYQYQNNYQQSTQNNYQYQNNYQQSTQNNYSDEELVDAYIGKNIDKIRAGGFSWNVFFFGTCYTLYRKMWLLSLLWFVANVLITSFLPSLSILSTVIGIVVGIKFKELYLKNARENVEKIKANNPTKSREEIKQICAKRGGTTIIPVIIIGIIYVIIIAIIFIAAFIAIEDVIDESKEYTESINGTYIEGELSDLRFEVPSNFESSEYNDESYAYYTLSDTNNYCSFSINTTKSSYYDSPLEYLQKNVYYSNSDTVSEITDTYINGVTWKYMLVEKSYGSKQYYYVTNYGQNIYKLEYNIYNDDGKCSNEHTSLLDSLKFEW